MENLRRPTLLDCTLRDGGYYNKWDFDIELAKRYASAMTQANVDIIEVGFRSLQNNSYKGPFAFSSEVVIQDLKQGLAIDIAVMVDVKEFVNAQNLESSLVELFPVEASESAVSFVRLATDFSFLDDAIRICAILKRKGYRVCINLMQAAGLSNHQLEDSAKRLRDCKLSAFYLADSTGSLSPGDYAEKVKFVATLVNCPIGIHAHDNMGKALENTLSCYELGATWLDSTVLGMGRGPGNTHTEELLLSLEQMKIVDPINIIPLLEVAERYFEPLKEAYHWGKNRYYFISGMYQIHPSYVQEMLGDTRYCQAEIYGALNFLKNSNAKSFEAERLLDARSFYSEERPGSTSLNGCINNETFCIIGSGPSAEKNRDALEYFIRELSPVVFGLNSHSAISEELIEIRSICHPMRLLADVGMLADTKKRLLTPYSMLPANLQQSLASSNIIDYGISIRPGEMKSNEFCCTVPYPLAIAYTLAALASVNSIKSVILAGMDGYSQGDPRNSEMESVFGLFLRQYPHIEIFSVTPTCYDIETKSIHGLLK